MNIDDIQIKYMTALSAVTADGGWVEWPAVRLALRLAIGEAYAAGAALADDLAAIVASQAQATPEQRQAESAINQIARLAEWLEANEPALYHNHNLSTADAVLAAIATLKSAVEDNREDASSAHQELTILIAERDGLRQQITQMAANITALATDLRVAESERNTLRELYQAKKENEEMLIQQITQMNADNADLLNKVHQAQVEIDRLTRQNVIATDTFNSLAAERTNGAGPNPTTAPGWNRSHPAWSGLPKADLDVIDQLASGATAFRKLSKTLRRDLVLRVLRSLAVDGEVKSLTYDKRKPDWMPTSGAVVMLSETGRWSNLVAMTETTPA